MGNSGLKDWSKRLDDLCDDSSTTQCDNHLAVHDGNQRVQPETVLRVSWNRGIWRRAMKGRFCGARGCFCGREVFEQ